MFDPKGTNSFGPEDFERVCDQVGERFSPAEVDQMIDYADKDRDGGISYEEFVAVVTRTFPKVWDSVLIDHHPNKNQYFITLNKNRSEEFFAP